MFVFVLYVHACVYLHYVFITIIIILMILCLFFSSLYYRYDNYSYCHADCYHHNHLIVILMILCLFFLSLYYHYYVVSLHGSLHRECLLSGTRAKGDAVSLGQGLPRPEGTGLVRVAVAVG